MRTVLHVLRRIVRLHVVLLHVVRRIVRLHVLLHVVLLHVVLRIWRRIVLMLTWVPACCGVDAVVWWPTILLLLPTVLLLFH